MLERHLHLPHELVCVTDDASGMDKRIRAVKMPPEFAGVPRCRRRMWQFAKERACEFGHRMLCIDLDVVIVRDITPVLDRHEPIVCWKVGYAGVYSGSFLLCDVGALDGAWQRYRDDTAAFVRATGEKNGSDQAMLNLWLRGRNVAHWTEADGFVTWFGDGYHEKQHHGMSATRSTLPAGARIVVLGSADKKVMDDRQFAFVQDHWL